MMKHRLESIERFVWWLNEGRDFRGDKTRVLRLVDQLQALGNAVNACSAALRRKQATDRLAPLVDEVRKCERRLEKSTRRYRTFVYFKAPDCREIKAGFSTRGSGSLAEWFAIEALQEIARM